MVHLPSPRRGRALLGLLLGFAGLAALRAQTLDPAFNLDPSAEIFGLARQADGKLIAVGNFDTIGGVTRPRVARINADGTVDSSFAPGVTVTVMCVAVQSDGRVLIGGSFITVGGEIHRRLARLNADGSVDSTFNVAIGSSNSAEYVKAIVLQPDGKIVVAGSFAKVNNVAQAALVRLNPDGSLDAAFQPAITGAVSLPPMLVRTVALQPDGEILIGGNFNTVDGQLHRGIARLHPDGTPDANFNSGTNGPPQALLVLSDGRVVVGGGFSEMNGAVCYYLGCLNANGTLDATFNVKGITSPVDSFALAPDGDILVGGTITSDSSPLNHGIALFSPSGEAISTFPLTVSGALGQSTPAVYAISVGPAQDIAIGGAFSKVMGEPRSGLARTMPLRPVFTAQSASRAVTLGGAATFTIGAYSSSTVHYQWYHDGALIPGATATDLTFPNVQPGDAGAYTAGILAQTLIMSPPTVLGVTASAKVTGAGTEVGTNIQHPNGNVYDQVKLEGGAASVNADPGQILRLSFLDLNGDIVQVEFSGAGTLTLTLDAPTGPVAADNYLQPGVNYMKGHAAIVIAGANETTNLSLFSVGRLTAANPGIFRSDVTYDGVADLAYVAILSANGKFGGLRAANANFFATRGITGVYAPGVQFTGPVYVNDISAAGSAKPKLVLGAATDVRITGGDLLQANDESVQVAGISSLLFTNGATSHGTLIAARANRGRLLENDIDITTRIVVNP